MAPEQLHLPICVSRWQTDILRELATSQPIHCLRECDVASGQCSTWTSIMCCECDLPLQQQVDITQRCRTRGFCAHVNSIVDIKPFWVVFHFLGYEANPRHPAECTDKVFEFKRLLDCVSRFVLAPARLLQASYGSPAFVPDQGRWCTGMCRANEVHRGSRPTQNTERLEQHAVRERLDFRCARLRQLIYSDCTRYLFSSSEKCFTAVDVLSNGGARSVD